MKVDDTGLATRHLHRQKKLAEYFGKDLQPMKEFSVIDHKVEIRPEAGAVGSCFLVGAGCSPAGQTFVATSEDPQANKLNALDFRNTAPDRTNSDWAIQGTDAKRTICAIICGAGGSTKTRNRSLVEETALEKTNSNCEQHSIALTTRHGELEQYARPSRGLTRLQMSAQVPCRRSHLPDFHLFSGYGPRLGKVRRVAANRACDVFIERNNVTLGQAARLSLPINS